MKPLHEAVYETANKLLDKPEFVELSRGKNPVKSESISNLFVTLVDLGYAQLKYVHSKDDPEECAAILIHPLAYEYYKKYGDQYVELLEATQRLVS